MFDEFTRNLMAMLFERSTINEFSGRLEDGRIYTIDCRRMDDVYFEGYIDDACQDFRGDTLDETLDKMDAYIAHEADLMGVAS